MIIGILILFLILTVKGTDNCTNRFESLCCANSCPFCGNCFNGNKTMINKTVSQYGEFGINCCAEIISQSNIFCNESYPPCIIINEQLNIIDIIIKFFGSGKLQYIIPVSVGLGLIVLFLLYTCCIFGLKKPPIKYKYIIHTLKDID